MRIATCVLLVMACMVWGCSSSPIDVQTPRESQTLDIAIQVEIGFLWAAEAYAPAGKTGGMIPLDIPLGDLGFTSDSVVDVLHTASLQYSRVPMEVEVPEWDEWLLWERMEVEVPEWDEWLLKINGMTAYRSTEWREWMNAPKPLEVEVPEWDEWLLSLTLNEMIGNYRKWLSG